MGFQKMFEKVDKILEIPMAGKRSLNVSVSAES